MKLVTFDNHRDRRRPGQPVQVPAARRRPVRAERGPVRRHGIAGDRGKPSLACGECRI
jgi:hypothetical protein